MALLFCLQLMKLNTGEWSKYMSSKFEYNGHVFRGVKDVEVKFEMTVNDDHLPPHKRNLSYAYEMWIINNMLNTDTRTCFTATRSHTISTPNGEHA